MKSVVDNAGNYSATAVTSVKNFRTLRYLNIHGTGDDNVHVLNTMNLAHHLQLAADEVPATTYRIHFVPDDAHSMVIFNF